MTTIVVVACLLLIVLDTVTGRRNSRMITYLSIGMAGVLPLTLAALVTWGKPDRLTPWFWGIMIAVFYLCLRIITARYHHLHGKGEIGVQGARELLHYAIVYSLVTSAAAVSTLLLVAILLIDWAIVLGTISIFAVAMTLILCVVIPPVGLALALVYAAIMVELLLLALPVILAFCLVAVIFVSVPIVLGLRALRNTARPLGLSTPHALGYGLLFLLPVANLFAFCKLRKRTAPVSA